MIINLLRWNQNTESYQRNSTVPGGLYYRRDLRNLYRWRLPVKHQCSTRTLALILESTHVYSHHGQGFTAVHLGAIVATLWVLLLNGVVGYQLLDDGTPLSIGAILFSAVALFVGTGYIALDTAFSYTHHFDPSLRDPNRNIGLYVLYQLVPLVFLFFFFILESILVLRVLGEKKPMGKSSSPNVSIQTHPYAVYLFAAAVLFAIGQIFQYVISTHLCQATRGKIDGALFETLFTLASVVMIWVFWSSITEDDWPMPVTGATYT